MEPNKSMTRARAAPLLPAALLAAALLAPNAVIAKEPITFVLDSTEYAAGVRPHGLDADTQVLGWKLGEELYFGRRHGDVDDFGFVIKRGDDQFSFTQKGIGWRRSLSLHR